MTPRWISVLFGALLAGAASAAPGSNTDVVRDLAGRVGPIIGSALACTDVARPRIQTIVDKFAAVIKEASSNEAERDDLTQLLNRSAADGRNAVTTGKMDCRLAERQLADLERSITGPGPTLAGVVGPTSAAAATANAPVPAGPPVRGVTDTEIRFGIAAPFSGPAKELGRQMKLGIDTAFNRVNDAGGVNGRMLRLIAADDGYEPTRTGPAMKQLYEKDQVFGFIGNVGTPTAAVGVPYALERRTLFFGAFTGANILRNDPPDHYVFNYRASYAEETDAVVRYLTKLRRIQPRQIAVFAQQDSYGDAGFAGVAKAFRTLGVNDSAIVRLNYKRNTVDVDEAVNQLKSQKPAIKAVVMVASYRAAAKFIEKTRDLYPGMIYTNVSFVGSTALAEELGLLGPRFATGVIVTQVVPAVAGYSSMVLEYKNALAKYFPGEAADYVSLEGYVGANVLIQALKRTGPQLDTERLIDNLESTRNLDLGLGIPLNYSRSEHQSSHKIWGTALDENGRYQPIELE
ncbi:amino acid/amide ABC transporter substrate-binding protein, HAAT family [Bradyrhizobium lablabi]|uniref:Amino acid/amide ABC transporter substrate-binding protein, HAAT family n=1 Tax=Bradyrhizobium lablabi TaxID=722472 RepID=A0A1M6JFH4_9BRAD|nr:ABC transporter substrate-binding protein [Bradyrhizobium lablabi]SHJ45451.1 amino acid/amide ABC transporter substrate-binding protein, HAAT family [Bradyrhizobium lablabi]